MSAGQSFEYCESCDEYCDADDLSVAPDGSVLCEECRETYDETHEEE